MATECCATLQSEISRMADKYDVLKAERNSIKKEKDSLETERFKLENECENLRRERDLLRDEINEINSLDNERFLWEKELDCFKKAQDIAIKERGEIMIEKDNLAKAKENITKERDDAVDKMNILNEELRTLKLQIAIDDINKERQQQQQQQQDMAAAVAMTTNARSNQPINDNYYDIETVREKLQDQRDYLQSVIDAQKMSIDELQKMKEEYSQALILSLDETNKMKQMKMIDETQNKEKEMMISKVKIMETIILNLANLCKEHFTITPPYADGCLFVSRVIKVLTNGGILQQDDFLSLNKTVSTQVDHVGINTAQISTFNGGENEFDVCYYNLSKIKDIIKLCVDWICTEEHLSQLIYIMDEQYV